MYCKPSQLQAAGATIKTEVSQFRCYYPLWNKLENLWGILQGSIAVSTLANMKEWWI